MTGNIYFEWKKNGLKMNPKRDWKCKNTTTSGQKCRGMMNKIKGQKYGHIVNNQKKNSVYTRLGVGGCLEIW